MLKNLAVALEQPSPFGSPARLPCAAEPLYIHWYITRITVLSIEGTVLICSAGLIGCMS